ncbi:MAG: ATP-binding cassette domain-containing protein [Betaproteobacteria bacterium]|nr:ATP-binding cassette domain-containing protein [Betaproteobacteria bacterium]
MTAVAATGAASAPLLSVRGLRKYFPVKSERFFAPRLMVQAVDDVSFSIEAGETLGIVGESGCGKSTTARLLMRLIAPDAGEVDFAGRPVLTDDGLSLRDLRRNMQMVFQDSYASLNPRLAVQDSIAFGPRAHGVSGQQATAKARELLSLVGLDPDQFGRRYPHELSGGQRQRVNVARALALDPKLVILDEAVSALDKSIEAQVLNLLMDLKARLQLTYLFISHDLNVVQYISDHVLVMYLGKAVEVGSVEDIYHRPRHPYTQALLASRPTMDPEVKLERSPLTGDPPNPINPPPGCRFRTRCAFAEDVCGRVEPALTSCGAAGHAVACYMHIPDSGHSRRQ